MKKTSSISLGEVENLKCLTKKIVKGAGITFVGVILGRGLSYVSHIVIARLLGAELFGLYILGLSLLNFSARISNMGLDSGALRYVSVYNGEGNKGKVKGTIIQTVGFSFLVGLVVGLALFVSAKWIATVLFRNLELTNIIKIFAVGVPFMASMNVAAVVTRAFQKMQYAVYINNIYYPVTKLILVILLYLFGLKLYGAIWATVSAAVLGLMFAFFYIKKLFPEILAATRPIFGTIELLKFSIPLLFANLSSFFLMWSDTIILGYFRPVIEVGIYRAAVQTALLLELILGAFNWVFAPIIANLYHRKELHAIETIFKNTTKWISYLSLPIFLIIIFEAKEILGIFGVEFTKGWLVLVIFSFSLFMNNAIGPVGSILTMTGHQNLWFCLCLLTASLNIILNISLIPKFGMLGAAIATATAIMLLNSFGLFEVHSILRMLPYDKRYWKGLLAGLAAFTVAWILKIFLGDGSIYSFAFVTLSIIGVFPLVLLVLKLDPEDKMVFNTLRAKFFAIR